MTARATTVFSAVLIGIGAAIIVRTALLGGGVGFLFGAIVLAAGLGRLYYLPGATRVRSILAGPGRPRPDGAAKPTPSSPKGEPDGSPFGIPSLDSPVQGRSSSVSRENSPKGPESPSKPRHSSRS
jgi:hypothetical protein